MHQNNARQHGVTGYSVRVTPDKARSPKMSSKGNLMDLTLTLTLIQPTSKWMLWATLDDLLPPMPFALPSIQCKALVRVC